MDVEDAKTELAFSNCLLSLGRISVSSFVFDLFNQFYAIGLYFNFFSWILPAVDCLVKDPDSTSKKFVLLMQPSQGCNWCLCISYPL